uniref:Uncharacterized protein n=1 Tax=Zea mays TaxID=4577 RepID=C4IZS3_MAIZE|nr:unknown [Zea mays]|eukprot:NP_001170668.1 uncharacterized protein LOC100384729 [Zea mays]
MASVLLSSPLLLCCSPQLEFLSVRASCQARFPVSWLELAPSVSMAAQSPLPIPAVVDASPCSIFFLAVAVPQLSSAPAVPMARAQPALHFSSAARSSPSSPCAFLSRADLSPSRRFSLLLRAIATVGPIVPCAPTFLCAPLRARQPLLAYHRTPNAVDLA